MEEKEKTKEIKLTSIVTGTAPAFELPTGEVLSFEEYLVWLGNLVYDLVKKIG